VSKRIFISKNASEIEAYREQLETKGYEIIAHSFLSFSPVEFNVKHDYDVIFFGSPRAVAFFTNAQSISSSAKIACVGSKTAEVLESMGHSVDFVGEKSSDPKSVAEDFKGWVEGRTSTALSPRGYGSEGVAHNPRRVLFPISNRSLKTIVSVIPENQKEVVVIYATEVTGKVVPECDVYAFSSPSNVEGFFEHNTLPDNCEVIAWGKSTEGALEEMGVGIGRIFSLTSLEGLISSIH